MAASTGVASSEYAVTIGFGRHYGRLCHNANAGAAGSFPPHHSRRGDFRHAVSGAVLGGGCSVLAVGAVKQKTIDSLREAAEMGMYASQAARALKLSPFVVSKSGVVFQAKGWDSARKPITCRGIAYASQTDLATAMCVTLSAVSVAKKRGTLDLLGLASKSERMTARQAAIRAAKVAL